MKKSKYNLFYHLPGTTDLLAYNSRTNALAKMSKEDYEAITDIINGKFENKELTENLKYGGYILEDEFSEKDYLKYKLNQGRYRTDALGLTIAPTLGCNFRCIYCYEEDQDRYEKMDEAVREDLINLIKSRKNTIKLLSVTWYGGEPLMAMDVIESLSKEFLEICKENKIAYSASIITNGYLLTKEIVKKLNDLSIRSMQVTLDGNKETHDKRRFLANGRGTFDKIISNLKECKEDLPHTDLRINTDRKNVKEVYEVLGVLKQEGLMDKVHPYVGWVDASNGEYEDDSCLNFKEFAELEIQFSENLVNEKESAGFMNKYPHLKGNCCGADAENALIVAPDGELYKCWDDIGRKEYSVGNLRDGITSYKNVFQYLIYDPTEDEMCKECEILPICMGGCPRKRIDGKSRCSTLKTNMEDYVIKVGKELIKKN